MFVSLKYLMLAIGLMMLQRAQAQVKPTSPGFIPACDLQALNRAYINSLNHLRHQLDPRAPLVVFDPALLIGTILHTARMEQADSLFHANILTLRSAELIGTKRSIQTREVEELVRFIQTQLQSSERHCQIQSNLSYVYVAVAATQNFYTVRLWNAPAVITQEERVAFAKLGLKQGMAPGRAR